MTMAVLPMGVLAMADFPGPEHAMLALSAIAELTLDLNTELRLSFQEFVTGRDDTPALKRFHEGLRQPVSMTWMLSGDSGFGGMVEGGGTMSFDNVDGQYDYLSLYYATDSRDIEIRVGERGTAYAGWTQAFVGVMGEMEVTRDLVRIPLHDRADMLDVPVAQNTYAGTGGAEGGEDIEEKNKPCSFGWNRGVTPVLLSAPDLLFQFHDGPVQAVTFYANNVAIDPGVDHATVADLLAANPAPGTYDTCIAFDGLAKLDFNLDGQEITCDVQGDASGDGFVDSIGGIIKRVVLTRTELTEDDLDLDAFEAFEAAHPYPVGYHVGEDETMTVAELLAKLVGFGKWIGFTPQGKLTIGIFTAPSGAPRLRLDPTDTGEEPSVQREPMPGWLSPRPWRWLVEWGHCWTPQTGTSIAADATDERRAFVGQQVRVATAESAVIRHNYPRAPERRIEAYYRDQADAQAEAERLLDLYGPTRFPYRIPLPEDMRALLLRFGRDCVHLTNPRFDLAAGRLLRVYGFGIDGEAGRSEIYAYG